MTVIQVYAKEISIKINFNKPGTVSCIKISLLKKKQNLIVPIKEG